MTDTTRAHKGSLKAIGMDDVSIEVAQWLGNFYQRMRSEISALVCLCAAAEHLGDSPDIKPGSRKSLYMQELPYAMLGLENRMLMILSEIDTFCRYYGDGTEV